MLRRRAERRVSRNGAGVSFPKASLGAKSVSRLFVSPRFLLMRMKAGNLPHNVGVPFLIYVIRIYINKKINLAVCRPLLAIQFFDLSKYMQMIGFQWFPWFWCHKQDFNYLVALDQVRNIDQRIGTDIWFHWPVPKWHQCRQLSGSVGDDIPIGLHGSCAQPRETSW